jgi:FkbM family methyltransferase
MTGVRPTVVFAGCARDCERHLPGVLANLDSWARRVVAAAFVIVENDSQDGTQAALRAWLQARPGGTLLTPSNLREVALRTARIAYARNMYLDFIARGALHDAEFLVVVDFDDVNDVPISDDAFAGALEVLHRDASVAAVFACSEPVYYDIWALRHPEWCPNDAWVEVCSETALPRAAALERYIYSRQIAIPSRANPIPVRSAFGGLAMYRLSAVQGARYQGLTSVGTECCEHVSFNLKVLERGRLYVLPSLRNRAGREHVRPVPGGHYSRILLLEQDGESIQMLAPPEHMLDSHRASHPLYDRQLPRIALAVERTAPGELFIDVGANIGDTAALLRLAGCANPILAVEPSAKFLTFARLNTARFADVTLRHAFVGPQRARLALNEHHGTASSLEGAATDGAFIPTVALDDLTRLRTGLVKTDTDGLDAKVLSSGLALLQSARPLIWSEAEVRTADSVREWIDVLTALAEFYRHVIAFDNFGFPVVYGDLAPTLPTLGHLLAYCQRHLAVPAERGGEPRIYYLDLALFPDRFETVYRQTVERIEGEWDKM